MPEHGAGPVVLVTRPAVDAADLVWQLEERGFETLSEPMLTIELGGGPAPSLEGVQAILFTSANGVRAYGARGGATNLPAYAVGDATAAAARALGFAVVESAGGDVSDLVRLVIARCETPNGTLLHAAGSKLAGALGRELEEAGFDYRREVLYSAKKATALSRRCRDALAGHKIAIVLFYSPRTAESFATLATQEGVAAEVSTVTALCLSDAVAVAARRLPWRRVVVATAPTQEALLAGLDQQLENVTE